MQNYVASVTNKIFEAFRDLFTILHNCPPKCDSVWFSTIKSNKQISFTLCYYHHKPSGDLFTILHLKYAQYLVHLIAQCGVACFLKMKSNKQIAALAIY